MSAAHILDLLDSVQDQLAEIRRWADQLIAEAEKEERNDDDV